MRVPARTAWAGAGVALLVAACGGGGDGGDAAARPSPSAPPALPQAGPVVESPPPGTSPPPGAQVVDIKAVNNAYDPAVVRVHPGAVHINLHNADAELHNLVVPAATGAKTDDVLGDQTVSLDIELTTKANYEFFCSYHRLTGMQGVLVVA